MTALDWPTSEGLGEAERIAVLYAPKPLRPRYHLLLLLDGRLGRIALVAREPALAQLKLAWWRDALADGAVAGGDQLVRQLASAWEEGTDRLAGLIDAWEELAVREGAVLPAAERLADARAEAFAQTAGVAANDDCRAAARRWTFATLAAHEATQPERDALCQAGRAIRAVNLPRSLRPLAVLDGLADRALKRGSALLLGDRLSPLAALRLGIFGR
jgi:phytoene synthase